MAILLMAAHVCMDVVARNLAATPLTGTTEVVSYWYMVAIVFCTLGGVQARDAHIRVDLVNIAIGRWRSAPRIDGALTVLTALLFLAACLGLVFYTGDQALTATLRAERVEFTSHALPVWPGRWLVPLGFALTAWVSACDLVRAIRLMIRAHVPAGQGAR
ncbi:TRAP transporter small permease [Tistrella bauzanensis]|uniref:TRAP transporter small permease subunit n=1 Tax=Tistrella TaxID=171436 RepID=UPI0031F7168F